MKILKNIRFLFLFLLPFGLLSYYVVYVQTELYKSSSTILIKNLKQASIPSDMLSALIPSSSSERQDSKLLEKFIYSSDMFKVIDKKFSLKEHYRSEDLDFFQKMYSFSSFEDFLKLYRSRVVVAYDELSKTIDISFFYTDANRAREILEYIIVEAEKKLNMYDKENGNKLLDFIKGQEQENNRALVNSIKKLTDYQNRHKTIDPSLDIKAQSGILAEIERQIVEKELKLSGLKQYMNANSIEVKRVKDEISSLERKVSELRAKLSGRGKNKINKNLFDFETLKSEVEFNKERYKQTLIQLDMALIQSTQNAKNLITITKPSLPDEYNSPKKLKNIITLFLVLFMFYGIISMIYAIIKDHRD